MTSLVGTLISGDVGAYEIQRQLGCGSLGMVYLARDVSLNRLVALKLMYPHFVGDEAIIRRFRRDAQTAALFDHVNIVRMYALGTVCELPYFLMEYVEGASLDVLLRRCGGLPWQRAVLFMRQVASALDSIHGRGIIHCDVKPANILVSRHGRALLTDFGVARTQAAYRNEEAQGTLDGTPQYMSPEQCQAADISPASDLFSLGTTAYEMVTGVLPFRADSPAAVMQRIPQEPPPPIDSCVHGVPTLLQEVIVRLLEKNVERRYRSAADVLSDLARLEVKAGGGWDEMDGGAHIDGWAHVFGLLDLVERQLEEIRPLVSGRREHVGAESKALARCSAALESAQHALSAYVGKRLKSESDAARFRAERDWLHGQLVAAQRELESLRQQAQPSIDAEAAAVWPIGSRATLPEPIQD